MWEVKPFIFRKKVNKGYKVVPLNVRTNLLGPTKHFPSTTKEWFNSIYSFNSNFVKNLSIVDKNLIKLIRGYLNFYFNERILESKHLMARFRRLSVNKIFVSKAELKHNNSKVIITLYIYNEERRVLLRKIKRLETMLFIFSTNFNVLQNQVSGENKLLSLKDKLDMVRIQENSILFMDWLCELKSYITKQIHLEECNLSIIKEIKSINKKRSIIEDFNKDLVKIIDIITICKKDPVLYNQYENIYKNIICKIYLEKEMNLIAYYKLLLSLNKSKFEDKFLLKLKPIIAKLYNKEVEFNIVNLKTLYLNSDIFTETISLKLKNRNNKLLQILKSSLSMVKLPKVNRIREQYYKNNIKELWANKVNNLHIDLKKINFYKNDILNKLLLELFNNSLLVKEINKDKINDSEFLLNFVLNSLRYKDMGGIRLEAKGRLTRRFTASRSVFKIKWKGSLKNMNSSYKGLSSIMLKGYIKSNIQYSSVNSKTRNGAFGLKGWISSK
jgi:hypothetical protein